MPAEMRNERLEFMAAVGELDRLKQAKEFFQRYYEFEEAVKVNAQNKEYLKSYIHNQYDVEKEFDFKAKCLRGLAIAAVGALVIALIILLIIGFKMWLVGIIAFVVHTVLLGAASFMVQKYRLSEAIAHQAEVNEGITEQIAVLESRDAQLVKQRDDYYRGLSKRVDFMSLDYMDNIDQIIEIIENDEAETCEDAVAVFEQKLLMKEMTSFLNSSAEEPSPLDPEKAKKMFGDPLETIKQKRKKKKGKLADSLFEV